MRMAYSVPNKSASPTPVTRRSGSSTLDEMKLPSAMSPSSLLVDDRAKNIRKLRVDLTTVMPCCWTVWGRLGMASCSLFCTCTCAMSGSVPALKKSVTVDCPLALLLDDM